MTTIASYFAEAGVSVDVKSIRRVDRMLQSVERRMLAFQRRVERKQLLDVKVGIDPRKVQQALNKALFLASRNASVTIDRVNVSKKAMTDATKSLRQGRTNMLVEARLSQASLVAIRTQINSALSGITVRATGRVSGVAQRQPSTSNTTGGRSHTTVSPHSKREFSPWHNPMMIGGSMGAFMRYGVFSLPFVAGAFGLNTMSNQASMLEKQNMMMSAGVGDKTVAREQIRFIDSVGERLGVKTSDIIPSYAQIYAAARGTSLEPGLNEGFSKFMDYAAVMGIGGDDMKGALKAVAQMVGKGTIMA